MLFGGPHQAKPMFDSLSQALSRRGRLALIKRRTSELQAYEHRADSFTKQIRRMTSERAQKSAISRFFFFYAVRWYYLYQSNACCTSRSLHMSCLAPAVCVPVPVKDFSSSKCIACTQCLVTRHTLELQAYER